MKSLDLYKWLAGSQSDFLKPFRENEELLNLAKKFWNDFESSGIIIIITFVVLGILLAAIYYGSYNDKPGRHYTPLHWIGFLFGTFVLTFLFTWLIEYIMITPKLNGAVMLQMKIALCNAIYAVGLYLLTSIVWCYALPTNAYRLFKI